MTEMRVMKRAVCFILAFLMLTGSVEPGYLLPVSRAAALDAAEQSVCAASEDASPAAQGESAVDAAEPEEESPASEETPEETEEPEKAPEETSEEPEESDKEAEEAPDADEESDKEAEEAPEEPEESDKEAEEAPDASGETDKESEETPEADEETEKEAEEAPEESDEEEALHPQDATGAVRSVDLVGVFSYTDGSFTDLIRPMSEPTLSVVPIYKVGEEYIDAPPIKTQKADANKPNYLFFSGYEPDSEMILEADFRISNLPGTVTVGDDVYAVERYRVIADPVPEYYEQRDIDKATTTGDFTLEGQGSNVAKHGLDVALYAKWCQDFTIRSIVPNQGESTSFDLSITFTLPGTTQSFTLNNEDHGFATEDNGIFHPVSGIIPSGLDYTVNYIRADGYRMDEDPDTQINWTGTVPENSIEISCVNYPLNMSLPFIVDWKDNDNIKGKQPDNIYGCFKLQVRKAGVTGDEWTDFPYKYHATEGATDWTYSKNLTDEELAELEAAYLIQDIPNLGKAGNNYTFTGLPGADAGNNVLEYRVQCTAPDNYTANNEKVAYILKDQPDEERKFTMRLSHSISAQIEWMDDSNAEGVRPNPSQTEVTAALSSLRLYSRGSDGTVTDLTETDLPGNKSTWQWTSSGDTFSSAAKLWTLTVPGLPTYTDKNEEIEYFIVHGTDTQEQGTETVTSVNLTQTKVEGEGESATTTTYTYTPHYKNPTGNYASDETRCFDSGTITMLLSSDTSFSANIVWKDAGTVDSTAAETINARPAGTVTLWRYAHYQKGADTTLHDATLDEAFLDEQASQVVYVGADKRERPLCFNLPAGSKDATLITGKDDDGKDIIKLTYTKSDGTTGETDPIHCTLPSHDNLG